jgi:glutathione synthase/RimK-type ligase-like ATP-grasp enzyme
MILIITHKEDFTADFLIEKLNYRGIKYFRLNCEEILSENYSIKLPSTFSPFSINGNYEFDSVWFRRVKLPVLDSLEPVERNFILRDFETLLENIFQVIKSKRWLSHPNKVTRAENKLLQLTEATNVGFSVPQTIITNDREQLTSFINHTGRKVIIKPIRQGRIETDAGLWNIYTNIIDSSTVEELSKYDLTPCIIQEYINKQYELRITVVEGSVFAVKIDSQINKGTTVDWRREKLPLQPYSLPYNIEQKCLRLVKKLEISFGAIDMIVNDEGEYVFLEINPNGQWAWVEIETGVKISEAIIQYLTSDNDA